MEKISIEVEAVTATFLHVEPQGEARWRAAPFRGLARWWYRAVVGAAFSPEIVRKKEESLFGTSETPSKVVMRVFEVTHSLKSVSAGVNPGGRNADRQALPAGSKARIEILSCPHCSDPQRVLLQTYASLWTAIHLGGIGQRSRRGAGSLRITGIEGYSGPLLPLAADNPGSYALSLAKCLNEVRTLLEATSLRSIPTEPDYPVLHPVFSQVAVVGGPGATTEMLARKMLMEARRKCHRTRDGKGEYEFGGIGTQGERLSSPLWVRIAQFADSQALLVFTLMQHSAATGMRANWDNARKMITGLNPSETHWVGLGGIGND